MQTLWIDGAPRQFTPRGELRLALRAGRNMSDAERDARRGQMSAEAFRRFERLWAVATATEHPYTAAWSLDRWRARRERTCKAVKGFLA